MSRTALLMASIASLAFASAASAATTVFTDGFEGDAPGAPVASLVNFNITGTVDVVAPGNPYGILTPSNVVDLDGSPGPGEITSKGTFTFGANQFVDLSFVLGGAQRGSLSDNFFTRLLFNGNTAVTGLGGTGVFAGVSCVACTLPMIFTQSATIGGSDPFSTSSLFFLSVNAGTLQFAFGSDSTDNVGPLLDSATLGIGAAVPEPASWALMIAGFGMAGAVLRRRRPQVVVA